MPDNVCLGLENKHSTMATFDNPSYFTISGQSPSVSVTTTPHADGVESIGAKPKRFKSWFKLPKRPFRSKVVLNEQPEIQEKFSPPASPEPEPQQSNANDFTNSDAIYYNFCSSTQDPAPSTEANNDDDVFSDTSTVREIGSTRTLSRRRHSLGSWFRSSLAAVRKHNTGSSTASGLESHETVCEPTERPSTSSERALLSRNVSTSANCVASALTPERGRSAEMKTAKRSRLPVAVKSHVELRARARYARQEKLVRDNKAVSTSRIPRAVQSPHHRHQTASLDRRYTKSTEVLASKPDDVTSTEPSVAATLAVPEQLEAEDSFQQREDSCSTRRKSISSTTSRQRFVQRSRTIEDRHRSSCCGRMAAAAAASTSSSRGERRRASLDATSPSSHTRRRCQRCRDKAEPIGAEKVDVVIIFSKNCVVAYQWITYLTEILSKIFSSNERPPTRVTSRDIESLVNCSALPSAGGRSHCMPTPPENRFQRTEYQNVSPAETLDAERSARQHAVRKTVATASLQIVLLSKALLNHVGLHANDPLGTLLHPKRVLGLLLGVNETKDIMPLHRSALFSFDYWPKIVMLDQDMNSVTQFGRQAQHILCRSQPVALVEANLQPARFKITPKKLRSGEERVTLILLETAENIQMITSVFVGIDLKKDSIRVEKLSWINPYTATFSVPKTFLERGIIVKVQLKVGNASWGIRELKCQSKLGEISVLLSKCQLMGSPIEVMCQALNISPVDMESLDKLLVSSLNKSKVSVSAFDFDYPDDDLREEEFPTLLHFAARYGFKDMMWVLLECLGAIEALYVRNFNGLTALQLAEMYGHTAVVNCLNSFKQVVEAIKADHIKPPRCRESDYVCMNDSKRDHEIETLSDYDFLPNRPPVCLTALDYAKLAMKNKSIADGYLTVLPDACCQEEQESSGGAVGGPSEPAETDKSPRKTEFDIDVCQRVGLRRKDNLVSQAILGIPFWATQDEGSTSPKAQKANVTQGSAFIAAPLTVLPSRGSSPLSNWSSSDRSSVTSHLSHDSGTHFESSEERKALNNIHSDYDVPSSATTQLFVGTYVIPPPPRPVEVRGEDKEETDSTVRLTTTTRPLVGSLSPKSSPRPPPRFRNPFEAIELNPPASQVILGEDLGLIIANEEPDLMEQRPILLPTSPSNDCTKQFEEEEEPAYMIMTPLASRKFVQDNADTKEGFVSAVLPIEDNYVTSEELNMPERYLATLIPRFGRAQQLSPQKMSNSDNQLPASNEEALISELRSQNSRSDPSLASTPTPAARKLKGEDPTPPVPPRSAKILTRSPRTIRSKTFKT